VRPRVVTGLALPRRGYHLGRNLEKGDQVSKDLSDSANRKKLKKSSFALPEQEKYPIPDIDHARNALARVAQHGSEAEQKKVRAAVEKKYPSLKKDG
jgi:hypothetical protein